MKDQQSLCHLGHVTRSLRLIFLHLYDIVGFVPALSGGTHSPVFGGSMAKCDI